MNFLEIKQKLDSVSPLAYQRIVLKNFDFLRSKGYDLSNLMNPTSDMITDVNIIEKFNETIIELYGEKQFIIYNI
jgi:hypothetical protein